MSQQLCDVIAERAVMSSIFTYGTDAYTEVADLLTAKSFTDETFQILWTCAAAILADPKAKIDFPSLMSAAKSIGFEQTLTKDVGIIRAVFNLPVKLENARRLAGKLKKLEFARDSSRVVSQVLDDINTVTGDESIEAIIAKIESPILDITSLLNGSNSSGPQSVGEGLMAYMKHLAENQRDVVGIPSGYEHYDFAIGGGFRPATVNVVGARPKTGKAQPLNAKVQTPTGPRRMGDIQVGDQVCTPTGTSSVIAIHPQGELEIYRVTFSDGDTVECCLDHLWEVKARKRKHSEVLPLREIMSDLREADGRPKWSVRLPVECYREYREHPIDPYLLGVILGDGSTANSSVVLTSADQELVDGASAHLTDNYAWKKCKSKYQYILTNGRTGGKPNKYKETLKELGVFGAIAHQKFIPELYLNNSRGVRLALLQGLLDTDGSADKKGNVEFSTVSLPLAVGVKTLVQSLGGLCKIIPRKTNCDGKEFPSFRLLIRVNDPRSLFRMNRKIVRCKPRRKPPLKRTIDNVEFVDRRPAKCITISNEDGLYLTDYCVVTHNSLFATNIAARVSSGSGYNWPNFNKGAMVPVLQLDTEMTKEDQWIRQMAVMSEIDMRELETGKFANDPRKLKLVEEAIKKYESIPYDFMTIAGQPFEETEATIRRWISKKVGLNDDGTAKPCLIIFDYLKLMDSSSMESKNLAEFQVLGFIMTRLHNLAVKYRVPVLTFIQLNREGIDVEDTSVASGSDRIIWLCSNFSIYKKKSDEEMAEQVGSKIKWNRKLVPVVARHGAGLDDGDYINMMSHGAIAKIVEGPTRNSLNKAEDGLGNKQSRGIILEDTDGQPEVPFGS